MPRQSRTPWDSHCPRCGRYLPKDTPCPHCETLDYPTNPDEDGLDKDEDADELAEIRETWSDNTHKLLERGAQ